ncbi:MAG: hypothetical protein HY282_00570 [Nitrospirae bacterium]|nr:hypothetical protein [Candidatus Manganitrophaceae bacterium]
MTDESKEKGFWYTLPGILTAAAGVLTATAGLVAALNQAGFLERTEKPTPQTALETAKPAAPPSENPPAPSLKQGGDLQAGAGSASSQTNRSKKELPAAEKTNLLAPQNGGKLVAAAGESWRATADGDETSYCFCNIKEEAVYGFKDNHAALFDQFGIYISKTDPGNVKEFELLSGNDSPTGTFKSIGKFQTQNLKLFEHPYQEFHFPEVKAKYLKLRLLSTWGSNDRIYLLEVALLGRLEGS